jgi:hypothetical protein
MEARVMRNYIFALILLAAAPAMAIAGPVRDFENAMRAAYAEYRIALFQTNAGSAEKSTAPIRSFAEQWAALSIEYPGAPPQNADDPEFPKTLAAISGIADTALEASVSADLPRAHEILEEIRGQIAALHERNSIISFSDRMNAYHAKMEGILSTDYAKLGDEGMGRAREDAAILTFLAEEIARHPPQEAGDPSFGALLDGVIASTTGFLQASRAGTPDAVKAAMTGLKMPYSKLFLKFG